VILALVLAVLTRIVFALMYLIGICLIRGSFHLLLSALPVHSGIGRVYRRGPLLCNTTSTVTDLLELASFLGVSSALPFLSSLMPATQPCRRCLETHISAVHIYLPALEASHPFTL
jgi:hypothetical protein